MLAEILDKLGNAVDAIMGAAAGLGPTGGLLAAISATVILVWIGSRVLRL